MATTIEVSQHLDALRALLQEVGPTVAKVSCCTGGTLALLQAAARHWVRRRSWPPLEVVQALTELILSKKGHATKEEALRFLAVKLIAAAVSLLLTRPRWAQHASTSGIRLCSTRTTSPHPFHIA